MKRKYKYKRKYRREYFPKKVKPHELDFDDCSATISKESISKIKNLFY